MIAEINIKFRYPDGTPAAGFRVTADFPETMTRNEVVESVHRELEKLASDNGGKLLSFES